MDPLLEALRKAPKVPVKEDPVPEEERTITIPKKYLKGVKEGGIVKFKVILEDVDGFVLLPETDSEKEEEVKDDKDIKPSEKKDIKTTLSAIVDKVEGEDKNG